MPETKAFSESNRTLNSLPTNPLTNPFRLLVLFIILVSFGLRAYHLDFQSFWSDEGISILRSSEPLGQMLENMPIEHMPGYFVLLHYWLGLVGENDYAIRFLSLWPSVISVALVYGLGSSLGSRGPNSRGENTSEDSFGNVVAVVSAALLATAAFQIWYAQEARMYSWLLASGLASHLCLWRLLTSDNRDGLPISIGAACGYILATTLSVYLHFYGFLVPLTHIAFVIIWTLITRQWRAFIRWAVAGAIILILFLPWLPRAIGILEFSGWRAAGDPWQIPERYFTAYTVGQALQQPLQMWFIWGYIALVGLGIITWFRRRWEAGLFLVATIIVPLITVLMLAINNPDFHERYAIIVSGMIALAVAGGIGAPNLWAWRAKPIMKLGGLMSFLLTMSLVMGNGISLRRQLTESLLHKPDFRSAAYRIAQHERAGDVILVDGPDPEKVFLHYYDGDAPVHDLRFLEGKSWEEVSEALHKATDGAGRIWELLYFHGPGPVQMWTATNGWATDPTYHNNIRITLYGMSSAPTVSAANELQLDVDFGPGLKLVRSEVNGERFLPGDLVMVSTVWEVSEQLPDYKFSLRLLYQDGSTVGTWDYVPQNWIAPTSIWIVGSEATDQHGILLSPNLLPGQYEITLRLYDPATGIAIESEAGQDIVLREIRVETQ